MAEELEDAPWVRKSEPELEDAPWVAKAKKKPGEQLEDAPWVQPGVGDYASELGLAVARGAVGTAASTLEGYGALSPEVARQQRANLAARGLRGEVPADYAEMDPAERAALRTRRAVERPPTESEAEYGRELSEELRPLSETRAQDTQLYRAGKWLESQVPESRKILNPVVEDVAGGLGSVGANIATALVPGVGAPLAIASALGQGAGEAAKNAIEAGASEAQIAAATRAGFVPGSTEYADALLPFLGSVGRGFSLAGRIATRAGIGSATEFFQEGLQQYLQNRIAQGIYKPDQKIWEGVWYSAMLGGLVGGPVGGAIPGKRETEPTEATREDIEKAYDKIVGTAQLDLPFEASVPGNPAGVPAGSQAIVPAMDPNSVAPGAGPIQVAAMVTRSGVATDALPPEAPSAPPQAGAPGAPVAPPIIEPPTPVTPGIAEQPLLTTPLLPGPAQDQAEVQMPEFEPADVQARGKVRVEVANLNIRDWPLLVRDAPAPLRALLIDQDPMEQRIIAREWEEKRQEALSRDFMKNAILANDSNPVEGQAPDGGMMTSDGPRVDGDRSPSILAPLPYSPQTMFPESGHPRGASVEFAAWNDGRPAFLQVAHAATVEDWMQNLQPNPAKGEVHAAVHGMMSDKLRQVAGRTPVYIVPDVAFENTLHPQDIDQPPERKALASYNRPKTGRHRPFIAIRESVAGNAEVMAHLVLHEATHAATIELVEASPDARSKIRMIRREMVRSQAFRLVLNELKARGETARLEYALTNEKEFLSELNSNPWVQNVLANVEASGELLKELGIDPTEVRPTLWQAFVKTIQNLFGLPNSSYTLLEAALRLGDRIIDAQARLPLDRTRDQQADYAMGIRDNREAIRLEDPEADPRQAVAPQPELQATRDAMVNLWGGNKSNVPPPVKSALGHADRMNWVYKMFAGLDQLARSNKHFKPLIDYMERVVQMHLEEARLHNKAMLISRRWHKLGERGDRLAGLIDDVASMSYRSQGEVSNGIVRHPSQQDFDKLLTKHGLMSDQEAIQLFSDVMDSVTGPTGLLGRIEQSVIQRIQASNLKPADMAKRIQTVQDQTRILRQRPYFPWTNFGRHYVLVKDPKGKLISFETFEGRGFRTAASQQRAAQNHAFRQWQQDYGTAARNGVDIRVGILPRHVSPMIGMPATMLEEMSNIMDMTVGQINTAQNLVFADLADSAPMLNTKYQRKYYVPGYGLKASDPRYQQRATDLKRAFARFHFHGAKYYTRTKYLHQLEELVKGARGHGVREDQIADFMNDHLYHTVINAKGDWGALKNAIFIWTMGYSVAAATQNVSQTPMITFPFLAAKFGEARATKAMVKAMSNVKALYNSADPTQTTSAFEARALGYGIETGRITEAMATELAAASQMSLLEGFGSNNLSRNWRTLMDYSAWMFEQMEQVNRRVAFRAALDLAVQNPTAKYIDRAIKLHRAEYDRLQSVFGAAEARAVIAAIDAVEQTQYVYARWARPRFMRGRVAGAVFVFQKYIQSTLFMLGQNKDVFWRYALIMMLVGGLEGLPGSKELLDVLTVVGRKVLGRDFDLRSEARKWILQMTNDTIDPDIVLHGMARKGFGLPALLDLMGSYVTGTPGRGLATPRHIRDPMTGQSRPEGFAKNIPLPVLDRSRALSSGQVLPIDLLKVFSPGEDLNSTIASQAQKASGAAFSVAFNMYKAIFDHRYQWTDMKRWERAMPRALGDVSEAIRNAREGRERIRGGPGAGTTVLTYDWRDPEQAMELVARALGYNTVRSSVKWDMTLTQMEAKAYWDMQRKGYLGSLDEAVGGGRKSEIEKAQAAIVEFNKHARKVGRPEQAISAETMEKSLTQRGIVKQKTEANIPLAGKDIPMYREIQRLYPGATIDVRRPPSGQ